MARSRRNKRRNTSKVIDYFSKFAIITIIIIVICTIILLIRNGLQAVEVANQKMKLEKEIEAIFEQPTNQEEVIETEEKAEDTTIEIAVVGDILCGSAMLEDAKTEGENYDFTPMLERIQTVTNDASLTIGTMETNFIQGQAYSGVEKYNAPTNFAETIKQSGVDIVSIAHNHSLDYGVDGLMQTKQTLENVGLTTVGTQNFIIQEVQGIKIALIAYTYGFSNEKELSTEEMQNVNMYSAEKAKADIEQAKQNADYIMIIMHWGEVNSTKRNNEQEQIADYLVNLGANAIIGSHPAVPQPMQMKQDVNGEYQFISYSLGNYISSLGYENSNLEIIVKLQIRKQAETGKVILEKVTYTPLYVLDQGKEQDNRYVVLDVKEEAKKYLAGENNISQNTYEKLMESLDKIESIIRSNEQ